MKTPAQVSDIDLTISIVNYNTFSYLEECLDSIFANADGLSLDVIAVDNASREAEIKLDEIRGKFPQVRVIANKSNRYFTTGHNQALAASRSPYFLILNPDTLMPSKTLRTLLGFLKANEHVGAVTCREVDGDERQVLTSTRFPSLLAGLVEWTWLRNWPLRSVLDHYLMSDWQRDTPRTIDVGTGCFLMARTSLLKRFGGFDEGIRLYYSEHDLCQQIANEGFQVHFLPDAYYVHIGQRSSSQESLRVIRKIHFDDMLYYFAKYHGKVKARAMIAAIRSGRSIENIVRRVTLRLVSSRRQNAIS